ncbi:MAG: sulfite exporter TauE/SafE family protein [Burkholderiales bacterium]
MSEMVVWTTLTFIVAGFVKGVIGMGLPTVAVALLGLSMTPAQAAALMVVPSLVTNIWQALAGTTFVPVAKRLWSLLLGIAIGTCVIRASGASLSDQSNAMVSLGVALCLYGVYGLLGASFSVSPKAEPWLSPVIGLLTGAATGATGVFVIPSVPYLQALGLPKEQLVQALGIVFSVATIALALLLLRAGDLDLKVSWISAGLIAPALIGMAFGQVIRSRVSITTFRRCFFAGTLLLGAHLTFTKL